MTSKVFKDTFKDDDEFEELYKSLLELDGLDGVKVDSNVGNAPDLWGKRVIHIYFPATQHDVYAIWEAPCLTLRGESPEIDIFEALLADEITP